jgi:hypothetical protein
VDSVFRAERCALQRGSSALSESIAKLDGFLNFVASVTEAMHQAQPFYEACCIAKRRDAADISSG